MGHYDECYEAAEEARRKELEKYHKAHGWGCTRHKEYNGSVVPTNGSSHCNNCWTIFIRARLGKQIL